MALRTFTAQSQEGITWHVEQRGHGPNLVLIPSGEGDCESFAHSAAILATDFAVTTFDMPGMSRTSAPPEAVKDVTGPKLARQVVGLLDVLGIDVATFYGCSSGAMACLCLVAYHSEKVRSISECLFLFLLSS